MAANDIRILIVRNFIEIGQIIWMLLLPHRGT